MFDPVSKSTARSFLPEAFSGHFDFLRGALEVGSLGAAFFNLLQGVCVIRAHSILYLHQLWQLEIAGFGFAK